ARRTARSMGGAEPRFARAFRVGAERPQALSALSPLPRAFPLQLANGRHGLERRRCGIPAAPPGTGLGHRAHRARANLPPGEPRSRSAFPGTIAVGSSVAGMHGFYLPGVT